MRERERERPKKNYALHDENLKSRFRKTFFPSLNSMQCNISITAYLLKFSIPFAVIILSLPISLASSLWRCLSLYFLFIYKLIFNCFSFHIHFSKKHNAWVGNFFLLITVNWICLHIHTYIHICICVCVHIYIYAFPIVF